MSNIVFSTLRASYSYMTKTERRIADVILSQPQEFIGLSMAAVSRLAQVSQGSINNFAEKFFSVGFSALKLQVAGCLAQHTPTPPPQIPTQDVKASMQRVMTLADSSFAATIQLNSEQTLSRVVQRIIKARKIDIYGVYYSGITARDLCFQLIRLGIPANYVEDTFMCAVSASTMDENSLVIAISSSGRTAEIVDAVQIARENHVPIVSLTTNPFSPLAKISDEVLLSAALDTDAKDKDGRIRMAQLFVTDSLTSYLHSVLQDDPVNRDRLRKFNLSHSIMD